MPRSDLSRRRNWLIVRQKDRKTEVLTVDPGHGRTTLPIFSYEEEAEMFLLLGTSGPDWRIKETWTEELISILLGPRPGAERVALDPPPKVAGDGMIAFVSMDRRHFLRALLRESRPSAAQNRAPAGWAEAFAG